MESSCFHGFKEDRAVFHAARYKKPLPYAVEKPNSESARAIHSLYPEKLRIWVK